MKELIAMIRPGQSRATKQKLEQHGFFSYTERKVSGRGKQRGLQYTHAAPSSINGSGDIPFLPKRMITLFVRDEDLTQAMAILLEANKTGEIGDGKIFVCPVEEVVRIRTDERSEEALV